VIIDEAHVAAVALDDPPASRSTLRSRIELAWRTGDASSPAARALIEHAREAIAAFA
jgi:DNA-binding transcriptional LysR family regulator